MQALYEQNRRELAESKLHELKRMDDVSQVSQEILAEVSQTYLDDDTSS